MSHGACSRRHFLSASAGIGAFASTITPPIAAAQAGIPSSEPPHEMWPRQDPALVLEFVGVCHRDVRRVTELVERQPALANAAVDWSFGDWEDGLGAASHVGRREIAEVLLAHGARPSIFSAAMMGQLEVVKAFIAASPGVQRTRGAHGITLLAHARAGGNDAEAVVEYLQSVGDADRRLTTAPLDARDREAVVGRYRFGLGPRDYLEIDVQNDQLGIARPGITRHFLRHMGDLTFFPSGVPSVKITFIRDGARAARITIADRAGLVIGQRA